MYYSEYLKTLKQFSRRVFGKINRNITTSFPVMNYGTYLRTISIDYHIEQFLLKCSKLNEKAQIINLGCGSDLRMINLLNYNYKDQIAKFIDVDFDESIKLKDEIISNNESLKISLDASISTNKYHIAPSDLKDAGKTISMLTNVTNAKLPTLIITECVLCYMSQQDSQNLIDSIMNLYESGTWISYDPIGGGDDDMSDQKNKSHGNDRFGIIMQSNLRESRNLEMPTLMTFNSKEKYSQRWNKSVIDNKVDIKINDMWEILNHNVSTAEKKRLRDLQFLDELEELKVMQTHYILLSAEWKHAIK
ncbi:leucine carboxy methyltransferase NDAI_0H01700 [Naumovozyma dairenensis CBS 421]|uniref:Leucine carboxyl methyltransferase 1 n=1 Tax=Naumovozyma dairenensis (strain ATCC 10597 / BCRC 20456 / CBS 421 / NBRC 0211 / NRRL Y-12639) TaxID=1071378 RepID=G0WEY3_NAUDC|nr:hypothetical protein NDAI_0H01700 [Naumovozyma dairenensis CBS 421]CCD26344.1 hypothetical protein NDAI_0H01700 [Naumovozyma dairenensis CBS 421]